MVSYPQSFWFRFCRVKILAQSKSVFVCACFLYGRSLVRGLLSGHFWRLSVGKADHNRTNCYTYFYFLIFVYIWSVVSVVIYSLVFWFWLRWMRMGMESRVIGGHTLLVGGGPAARMAPDQLLEIRANDVRRCMGQHRYQRAFELVGSFKTQVRDQGLQGQRMYL